MKVIGTEFYSSFKQKEHLITQIKKKFDKVKIYFGENLLIYEYESHKN